MGKQGIFLENCIYIAFVRRYIVNQLAIEKNLALVRVNKPCNYSERCGFSAS
jgi:hypothetical protein